MIAIRPIGLHVITVPPLLHDQTFEQVLDQLTLVPSDASLLLDARNTTWASPYGLTALLCLAQTRAERPQLLPPEREDTASYWSRGNFFRYAEDLFEIKGRVPLGGPEIESGTLLPITFVSASENLEVVLAGIQVKSTSIITQSLHLKTPDVMGFSKALSELCQHVANHSDNGVWVCMQNLNYRKRMGRHIVQIALCSVGKTMREVLEAGNRRPLTERWDDGVALETALIPGTSFYPDRARDQGFKGIRGYLRKWKGKLAVRSGTARVADVPPWDDDVVRRDNLAPFPGVQVFAMIPEDVER